METTTATHKALRITEIVHAIVSFLWRYHPSELQHQLCRLVLVCKDLHQICTPLLWRDLTLQVRAFCSFKPFPFSILIKHSLTEQEFESSHRRELLVVCWFKTGLRKYGSLVRSITWRDLREGEYSHSFHKRVPEDRRMGRKRGRIMSKSNQGAQETTEHVNAGEVLPGDLPAYNFDEDTDDDDMEDRLLNIKTLPKDDGGVKFRTWILKFCPNLESMTVFHLSAGMDIYRPFFIEAARRTMLSSVTIIVQERDCDYSYSGNTLTDFFESVTGIANSNDSENRANNSASKDTISSKGIISARTGHLLDFSMEDVSYYEGGDDRGQKQPWFLLTRMLDTHPNLRSFRLYYFTFIGDFVSSSPYPAMRRLEVNLDGFNEENLSSFLSLFPNLEVLDITVRKMSMSRTLALICQHCPLLSDLKLFLTPDVFDCYWSINTLQHSMPHLQRLAIDGIRRYHWVRPV